MYRLLLDRPTSLAIMKRSTRRSARVVRQVFIFITILLMSRTTYPGALGMFASSSGDPEDDEWTNWSQGYGVEGILLASLEKEDDLIPHHKGQPMLDGNEKTLSLDKETHETHTEPSSPGTDNSEVNKMKQNDAEIEQIGKQEETDDTPEEATPILDVTDNTTEQEPETTGPETFQSQQEKSDIDVSTDSAIEKVSDSSIKDATDPSSLPENDDDEVILLHDPPSNGEADDGKADKIVSESGPKHVDQEGGKTKFSEEGTDTFDILPGREAPNSMLDEDSTTDSTSDQSFGYTSVWGRMRAYRLSDSLLVDLMPTNVPSDGESVETEDDDEENDSPQPSVAVETDAEDNATNSVNTQFVEGFDDIDKLLEEVEPPDELDVGASGSSMQEVFMGQGIEILKKRLLAVLSHVRTSLRGAFGASRFRSFIASRKSEDGTFILLKRSELVRARDSLWNTCNNLIRSAKDIWEDIFEDDDSLQFTIEMDEEESKLDSIRQQFAQRAASSSHSASDLPEENEDVGAAEYLQRLFKS